MGSDFVNPRGSSFNKRDLDHQRLFNSIHRARVNEVYTDRGTVSVILEKVAFSAEVTIPLLGLSVPYGSVQDQTNYKNASWGRYIPQVGDLLLVGFSSSGDVYALGYSAIFYEGLDLGDVANESTGGIGWGETSAKTLKPGDWDFRSARNASLYLGDKATIASGPYSIDLNQATDDITVNVPLLIGNLGSSKVLIGAVERFVLPTDSEPTAMPSVRGGTTCQEATFKVQWAGGPPEGQELATLSLGDVIDESMPSAVIMTSNATVPQPVRRYFSCTDSTGYITSYTEMVDAGGNFEVSSEMATDFQWSTLLANWTINNLSTSLTSVESIDISCNALLTLSGLAGTIIDSDVLVQLGGSSASEPFVFGTKLVSFLTALITAISVHTHPVSGTVANASVDFPITANLSLTPQLSSLISTKVMGA